MGEIILPDLKKCCKVFVGALIGATFVYAVAKNSRKSLSKIKVEE
ncbi:hypothetical protein [Methanosarcina sp. KYL-1]|nr:hypothetical protein [Methanosarcina sp. KYL-1]